MENISTTFENLKEESKEENNQARKSIKIDFTKPKTDLTSQIDF